MTELSTGSLYQRVGGTDAVKALVDKLHEHLMADARLTHIFSQVEDLPTLRSHTVKMLVAALGGPNTYHGRDMATAHAGYPIGDLEFTIVVDHIATSATELGLPQNLINEILEILGPLQRKVVQV